MLIFTTAKLIYNYCIRAEKYHFRSIYEEDEWLELVMRCGDYRRDLLRVIVRCFFLMDKRLVGRLKPDDNLKDLMAGGLCCEFSSSLDWLMEDYINAIEDNVYKTEKENIQKIFDNMIVFKDFIDFVYDFETKYGVLAKDLNRFS